MTKPRIVLLVGLPASGKSTWARGQADGAVLSSDKIRGWLSDDVTNQKIHRRVFATLRHLLRQRLELGRPVTYVDSTSLTLKERRPYLAMGDLYDCEVEAVYFDIPLAVCLERNRGRSRVVPEDAVREMALRMVAPSVAEGFSRIRVIVIPKA